MITDKEYPATHSMSTAWYAVDDDGNVAMLYIDNNGPAPQLAQKGNSLLDMITLYLNEQRDGFVDARFTESQADCLIDRLADIDSSPSADAYRESLVVQLAPGCVSSFMEMMGKYRITGYESPVVCLNQYRNLYLVDSEDLDDGGQELLKSGLVVRYGFMDLSGIYKLEDYEPNFRGWPYFIYFQDYSLSQPAVRALVPRILLKVDQISRCAAKQAYHAPGNFHQIDAIQLCSLFPFIMEGNASPEASGYVMPEGDGCERIYSANTFPESWIGTEKDPNITKWGISQGSDEPKCLYLTSPLPSLGCKKSWPDLFQDTWRMWYVYNILHGSDFIEKGDYTNTPEEKYALNYDAVVRTFPKVLRDLEEIVDFISPWVIVAESVIVDILKEHFEISGGCITIGDAEYPFHTNEDLEESGPDIVKQYLDKPYRGKHFNRVGPLKEEDGE